MVVVLIMMVVVLIMMVVVLIMMVVVLIMMVVVVVAAPRSARVGQHGKLQQGSTELCRWQAHLQQDRGKHWQGN